MTSLPPYLWHPSTSSWVRRGQKGALRTTSFPALSLLSVSKPKATGIRYHQNLVCLPCSHPAVTSPPPHLFNLSRPSWVRIGPSGSLRTFCFLALSLVSIWEPKATGIWNHQNLVCCPAQTRLWRHPPPSPPLELLDIHEYRHGESWVLYTISFLTRYRLFSPGDWKYLSRFWLDSRNSDLTDKLLVI